MTLQLYHRCKKGFQLMPEYAGQVQLGTGFCRMQIGCWQKSVMFLVMMIIRMKKIFYIVHRHLEQTVNRHIAGIVVRTSRRCISLLMFVLRHIFQQKNPVTGQDRIKAIDRIYILLTFLYFLSKRFYLLPHLYDGMPVFRQLLHRSRIHIEMGMILPGLFCNFLEMLYQPHLIGSQPLRIFYKDNQIA